MIVFWENFPQKYGNESNFCGNFVIESFFGGPRPRLTRILTWKGIKEKGRYSKSSHTEPTDRKKPTKGLSKGSK